MSSGFDLDPGELTAAAASLKDSAQAVQQQAAGLSMHPDAGQSSGDVSGAFARLSEELQKVATAVSNAAGEVEASISAYQSTDARIGNAYEGLGRP